MLSNDLSTTAIWAIAFVGLWARVSRLERKIGLEANERPTTMEVARSIGYLIAAVVGGLYLGFSVTSYFMK